MKNVINKYLLFVITFVLLLPLTAFASTAAGDNIATVQYDVTYGQTEARTMLDMINSFRTGSDAWYWNSDNKNKTYCKNLGKLTYDYELEKVAMQRAAEIAISFSHTRPNGEICFSLYPDNYYARGENIAAGHRSALEVMEDWKETDLPYSGQGHRRNMLSSDFNAVGFAKVYVNGCYYWVQEFGYTTESTKKTTASTKTERVSVDVDFTNADYTFSLSESSMKLKCGVIKPWPKAEIRFRLPSAWPSVYTDATVAAEFVEPTEEKIIFTREDGICAMGEGDSYLSADILGKIYKIKVRCDHSYYDTYVVYETCTESGSVIVACPCGSKYDKTPPPLGHDYKRVVEKATTQKDGYAESFCTRCDSITEKTVIKAVGEFSLSQTQYIYNGKTINSIVTVKNTDGDTLKEGTDYSVKYDSESKLPGRYYVMVALKGDYEGSAKLSFTVLPKKTSKVTAESTDTEIKLSWNKVTGATGYRVYLYNNETGKYEAIKTLTGTTYTVKKLKGGKSYKFAVKTYTKTDGETLWSTSSKTVTAYTKLATPVVKITAGTKKATLKWSKVENAEGYQVYMKTADGYKKIKVTSNNSYTKSDLKKGSTYNFRVRAYCNVDGKYIYSGYNTYSVKIK